jgi:tRNA-specific adenosine deaminase 3
LLEISPALLFSAEEYEAHGRHTVLDHYTFKWRDGRMALALGLGALTVYLSIPTPKPYFVSDIIRTGSLFNHSDSPNVSYSIDTATESIRYTTVRAVEPDEELCIFYGSNLWFNPAEAQISDGLVFSDTELVDDGWGGLSAVAGEAEASSSNYVPKDTSDPNEVVSDEDLPFTRVKLTSDEDDEETLEAVRTGEHTPRVPARLLMPNTSTGMGRGHP